MSRELARRDVLAGFCAALALCFAPLERFVAGIEKMIARIMGRPDEEALVEAFQSEINGILRQIAKAHEEMAFREPWRPGYAGLSAWLPDSDAGPFFGVDRSARC